MAKHVIRRCFNVRQWQPTADQFERAIVRIQPEELDRLVKFAIKEDFRSGLIGRLLIRQCIRSVFDMDNRSIQLRRTKFGKPIWTSNDLNCDGNDPDSALFDSVGGDAVEPDETEQIHRCDRFPFDFNVSHQGDWCVLAAESDARIGVDVMRVKNQSGSRSQADYFRLMRSQFTEQEWKFVEQPFDAFEQIARFIRLWSLKESFLKAQQVGITIDLRRIQFMCHDQDRLSQHRPVCSTRVFVDGREQSDWRFEEWMLDSEHVVCVAVRRSPDSIESNEFEQKQAPQLEGDIDATVIRPFERCQFEQLLDGLSAMRDLPNSLVRTLHDDYERKRHRVGQ